MDQSSLFARQINTCPSPYQYYACSNGPGFHGCCSTNACNNVGCPVASQLSASTAQTTTTSSITSTSLSQESTVTVTMSATSLSSISSSPSTASFTTTSVENDPNAVTATTTTVISTTTSTSSIFKENTATTTNSSNHKAAIIGGSVGGVLGALFLFMAIFLWCRRKRKTSSNPLPSNEKGAHKRTSSAFQENSSYDLSSGWSQPSENYYHKQHVPPFGHVDRTRSPALSELDSSPIRRSFIRPSPSFHSDTLFELDSVSNNRRTTRGSDPWTSPFPSASSRNTRRDSTGLGHNVWRSSETDLSNISSDRGGIRLARSTAELPVKSDHQHLGRDI